MRRRFIWEDLYGNIFKGDFDGNKAAIVKKPDSRRTFDGNSLIVVNDSITYYANQRGILEANFNTGKSKYIDEAPKCNVLFQDKEKNLWAGTKAGLLKVGEDTLYLQQKSNGQPMSVSHIYEDPNGVFWLSTQQGLIKWTPYTNQYRIFDEKHGLPNNIIHAAYPDMDGNLWLSTNGGIVAFDTASFHFNSYFKEDGLSGDEQNYLSHARSPSGVLCFGGVKGITCFHPDSIEQAKKVFHYNIILERIEMYNKDGELFRSVASFPSEQGQIHIDRSSKHLNIKASLPYFSSSAKSFEWRLKEEKQEWREVAKNKNIFLLHMPYGKFTIQLRALSSVSTSQFVYKEIEFYRPPPLYYAWWFWSLIGLAIV